MLSWTEPGDLDRQIKVEERIRGAVRALGRWLRFEMGFGIRWRMCFYWALAVFLVIFIFWLNEAIPQVIAGGP